MDKEVENKEVQSSLPKKRKSSEFSIEEATNVGSDNDCEFNWGEFLEETNSTAVPPTAFLHVESSLENGINVGMVLEVPNGEDPSTFWVASVVMNCGPLLSLRYLGYSEEQRSKDFWWNIGTSESRPLGWCKRTGNKLAPPKDITMLHPSWTDLLLRKFDPIPEYLLNGNGIAPVDKIQNGMKLEVQNEKYPNYVWIASVTENVGGRLLLRYDGDVSGILDFWLFYLSPRIHSLGWAKQNDCVYQVPPDLHSKLSPEEILNLKNAAFKGVPSLSPDILEPQELIETHEFCVGMKLEVLHPESRLHLYPGTVIKVVNLNYFIVEVDDYRKDKDSNCTSVCCHAGSQIIFPVNWSKNNGVRLHYPKGYLENAGNKEFDWTEYLQYCKAVPAPEELFKCAYMNSGFEAGLKLEALSPFKPNQICVATVSRVVEPLLWLQLDSIDPSRVHHVEPLNSLDLFPVGWCESNHCPLKPPKLTYSKRQRKLMRRLSNSSSQESQVKSPFLDKVEDPPVKENSKSWCSKIFFNHRCFSGPYLSKGRLAELPRHIGPGPVSLVMKEVLSLLINIAYKSSKVLQELQLRGKPDPTKNQEVLKAKYKGKCYRAVVEVVRKSEEVESFCKRICSKLECCPYLFGPRHVGDSCPDQCHNLTKTKYSGYAIKSPGRKKKRRWRILQPIGNKSHDSEASHSRGEELNSEPVKPLQATRPAIRHRFNPYILPKSSMVTRGAKIPNFSLEMKYRRQRVRKLISPDRPKPRRGRPPLSLKEKSFAYRQKVHSNSPEVIDNCGKHNSLIPVPKPVRFTDGNDEVIKPVQIMQLTSNPLNWTVDDVVKFIKSTECAPIAKALKDQEVDGQALLLMTLPVAQEYLELKVGPTIQLCKLIEGIKLAFFIHFANV